MKLPLYDVGAFGITAILLVGLFVLVGVGRTVPGYFENALMLALGTSLRSGVAVANEYRHRNGKP